MLYGFMKSLLHVIGQLKDKELLAFVARSLQHYTVFMIPFPKVCCVKSSSLYHQYCGDSCNSSAKHSLS
jgi:hypothetical protein